MTAWRLEGETVEGGVPLYAEWLEDEDRLDAHGWVMMMIERGEGKPHAVTPDRSGQPTIVCSALLPGQAYVMALKYISHPRRLVSGTMPPLEDFDPSILDIPPGAID